MNQTLQLDDDELWHVLQLINPVEIVSAQLVERTTDRDGHAARQTCRFVPMAAAGSSVLIEDLGSGARCLLPGPGLAALRVAALAALATNELQVGGVVTAAVLGSGPAGQLYLAVAARYVSSLSFVAVCPAAQDVAPRALELLAEAGINLSAVAEVGEATFGANILVVADPRQGFLPTDRPTRGALLINMSGQDLPDRLLNAVDGIYVDDAGSIEENRHRKFVRLHLDGSTSGQEPLWRPEGWYRPLGWRDQRRIEGDLGQVLCRAHPGRTHVDDVLLVELLGAPWLDLPLAGSLQRAALEHGIGTTLFDAESEKRE